MRTSTITTRTLAALTLWAGLAGGRAAAQSTPDEVLKRTPTQPGVAVTTPTGADLAACKADAVKWGEPGKVAAGVVVKDGAGRVVRQFIDTRGGTAPNIWSFYLNGVEAYREIDGNGNGKPDQYRWLGANGGKWGADADEDGKVDGWYVLSAEELSVELFQGMLTKDAKRIEALLPTEVELKAIGLPEGEITKLRQRASGAAKRAAETAAQLALTDKSKWIHLEAGLPQTTPADAVGGSQDLVKHRTTAVLVDKGDGKAEMFQTGELILVGRAWKMIDGPTPGQDAVDTADPAGGNQTATVPPDAMPLLTELQALKQPAAAEEMAKYHLTKAAILEKIVAKTQGAQQEPWLKQVVDAYAAAAEAGPKDPAPMQRLKQWQAQIEQAAGTSSAASYAAFRVLAAEYTVKIAVEPTDTKLQTWWREGLEAVVKKYPDSAEAPEAMLRLGVAHEFAGKDGEKDAQAVYEKLAAKFPAHPYAAKASGAVRRLTSEGQAFAIAGTTLEGRPFTFPQKETKPTVVLFWASWGNRSGEDLKQIAELAKVYGPKGLEVVTVSLDDESAKAVAAINAAQVPGTHLFAPGGLDSSPLGTAYGIQMVPHLFLVDKTGKVTNRNAQTGPMLKDEIEKLLK